MPRSIRASLLTLNYPTNSCNGPPWLEEFAPGRQNQPENFEQNLCFKFLFKVVIIENISKLFVALQQFLLDLNEPWLSKAGLRHAAL